MNTEEGRIIRGRLIQARKAGKFSQEEAAQAIGRTRQVISKWESGKSFPSPREFRDLCLFYGVTPDSILTGVDTIPREAVELLNKLKADFQDSGR